MTKAEPSTVDEPIGVSSVGRPGQKECKGESANTLLNVWDINLQIAKVDRRIFGFQMDWKCEL